MASASGQLANEEGTMRAQLAIVMLVTALVVPRIAASADDWELLGRQQVDLKREKDVVEVGRGEGRFSKLRIVVQGADVEMNDIKVIFADGSVFDPKVKRNFKATVMVYGR
jgi:hypothetical protein